MTFYYDPTIDYHHLAPVSVAGLLPAFYLAPQRRDDARALFEPAVHQLGLDVSAGRIAPPGPRLTGLTIALSREFGEVRLADALLEAANREYEPCWDGDAGGGGDRGEFTWGFGLGEPHPRGQYNAVMAAAEAMSEGAWTRLFNDAHPGRFAEPTVVDVDFPSVTLRQAWWDGERRRLTLATSPQSEAAVGRPTSFRITHLDSTDRWCASVDGVPVSATRLSDGDLRVELEVGRHRIEVFPAPREVRS